VLVEALAFVLPFWARIPVDEFYPRTPVHRFLAAHLDGQRFVATGGAMLVGTNLFYGLSTPNGHAFTEPRWKELLRAVEPRVFRTQTYSAFAGPMPLQRAQSPILDRMGVRYLVVPPSEATYGRAEPAGRDDGAISLEAGASFEAPIGRGPLRGVSLDVREALRPNDRFARIDVEVLGATGHTLAHSSRRTYDHIDPGPFVIPVAAEDVPANDNVSVRVRLVSRDGVLQLNGTRNAPRLIVIRPANDRLRLVFVDGAAVYQRLDALPKIRWASASRVIADPRTRLTALADEPSRANTVILDEPAPPGDDGPAEVVVTNDDGDRVRARVSAQGNGYLVVADAAVAGWQARVDGVRTRLVPADHALGAIHVPPGNHVVELDYHAPHARLGALVSIASLVLLVVCASVALRKRRSKGWQ
jgi:hypothetical protein